MRRRLFTSSLSVGLLGGPLRTRAQPAAAVRRVGVLEPGIIADSRQWPLPLIAGLRDLGWIEGKNLIIERRAAGDVPELLPSLMAELVRLKVDVVVTFGTPSVLAAKTASSTIPIVMAVIDDPVRAGVVASLARPGGNVTGNTLIEPQVHARRLSILKEMLPTATHIGELVNAANPAVLVSNHSDDKVAHSLGIQPLVVVVSDAAGLEKAFAELERQRAQALLVPLDALFNSNRLWIMGLATAHALPTMAVGREFVEAGAQLSYAANPAALVRNAAVFVDKILRGAKPSDLPIEPPRRFDLIINMRTAKAFGITVPQSLLLRADEVIE